MASAQELYKWNPLQGQYSGYTNAIRAAQSMGTAIDNLGVRLGDVGKMMADRYDRIRKEDTEYNTNQALSQIAQIRDQKGLQEALQNGTLDASHWNELYGRDFDYNKLTSAVSNIYGDILKRVESIDTLRDYTPEGKQALIGASKAITLGDPAALYKAIDNGQFMSNKAINDVVTDQLKQSNSNREYGLREASTKSTIENTAFNQQLDVYKEAAALQGKVQEENANNEKLIQGRMALIDTLGNLAVDAQGNLQPGELSKVNAAFKNAVEYGYPGSQQDFINDVVSRRLSMNSFPPPSNAAQSNYALFNAAFGGKFPAIAAATGQTITNTSYNSLNQQPTQNGQQQLQQGTTTGGTRGAIVTPPRNALTKDGNGNLGRDNFNIGEGVKIGGIDSNAFFNLSDSPRTRQIPQGSYQAHVVPFVDNKAFGKPYNASTKDGIDYNGEFNSLNISQGDALQLQKSYTETVKAFTGRLEAATNNKITSAIGLNNKGARTLINTLTSSKLPDKLIKEVGATSREQLLYQLQNDLNGKNLKQAEELFNQYLNPLLEHTYASNDIFGLTADVKRRALETARQTGFNTDNLVNILSIIADGSLKGDELKSAVTGLSAMTPSNVAFVKNMVNTLQANKDYLNSNEFKSSVYSHLIQQKDFKGNPLNIFAGESDLIQQRTEASQRDKNIGKNAVKAAAQNVKNKEVLNNAFVKVRTF